MLGIDQVVDLVCLFRADMLRAHKPPWLIGSDRDGSQIDGPMPVTDLCEELLVESSVTGKVELAAGIRDDEAAPETSELVKVIPAAPVLGGDKLDGDAIREAVLLPPVILKDSVLRDGTLESVQEPGLEAQSNGVDREMFPVSLGLGFQIGDALHVQMIIMIVTNEDDVWRWDFLCPTRNRDITRWSSPLNG